MIEVVVRCKFEFFIFMSCRINHVKHDDDYKVNKQLYMHDRRERQNCSHNLKKETVNDRHTSSVGILC